MYFTISILLFPSVREMNAALVWEIYQMETQAGQSGCMECYAWVLITVTIHPIGFYLLSAVIFANGV